MQGGTTRRSSFDRALAILVAMAAIGLLAPATAGAAKVRYGIKSADILMKVSEDEYYDGTTRQWVSAGDFNLGSYARNEEVGDFDPKQHRPGRSAGTILLQGNMDVLSVEVQYGRPEEECTMDQSFQVPADPGASFFRVSQKVAAVTWSFPDFTQSTPEFCGGAFGGAFDTGPYIENTNFTPAEELDDKTVVLEEAGTVLWQPDELAQEEGVTGQRSAKYEARLVLRRLPAK